MWLETRWSVASEVQDVMTELWSVKKVFVWRCIATWSHASHFPGRQQCNTLAHSTHARAWLAHGSCKFYRCERFYSVSLKQLPSCLVRVPLVFFNSCTYFLDFVYFFKYNVTDATDATVIVAPRQQEIWHDQKREQQESTLRVWGPGALPCGVKHWNYWIKLNNIE